MTDWRSQSSPFDADAQASSPRLMAGALFSSAVLTSGDELPPAAGQQYGGAQRGLVQQPFAECARTRFRS